MSLRCRRFPPVDRIPRAHRTCSHRSTTVTAAAWPTVCPTATAPPPRVTATTTARRHRPIRAYSPSADDDYQHSSALFASVGRGTASPGVPRARF